MSHIRVLFLGDIIGLPGRAIFQKHIGRIKEQLEIDAVIVNGENSSHGRGITSKIARFFKHNGVDVITSGNHVWRQKEIYPYLSEYTDLLRPANYPLECPGAGWTIFSCKGKEIGVISIQGRIFMRDHVRCPFKVAEQLVEHIKEKTNIIFIDFHAEATSEKMGLAYFLDGKISGLVGTHTHVQTADERVLPEGTAYITDLGMSGALNSMIGMKKGPIIKHLRMQMPVRFEVETCPPYMINGAYIDVDSYTGKAIDIQRVKIIDEEPISGVSC